MTQITTFDETKVSQVLTIDTHGNTKAFLNGLKPVIARIKELAPKGEFHIYKAGFSGPSTGMIYVVFNYPSFVYLAEVLNKTESDPEWIKGIEELEKTGRTIKSMSILYDVTP